jgi:proline dehydrogenase
MSLPFVTGAVLGVGLYYASKYIAAKVYDIYRSYKYSEKQRYMNDLDYQIKINVSLERQFDPTLQKAMLERLDLLVAHATEPKFNDQDMLVLEPSYSKLTVIQYENDKLAKRANKTLEDCVKWDEKFLNKDENSIYLKLVKKK